MSNPENPHIPATVDVPELVIGIDPGPVQSAYVAWWTTKGGVEAKGIHDNDEMLEVLGQYWGCGGVAVIEAMQLYARGGVGESVFDTLLWAGRFSEKLIRDGYFDVRYMYRSSVRRFHCHTMDSNNSMVMAALIDKYGKASTKKNPNPVYGGDYKNKMKSHLWSALALATIPVEDWLYFEKKSFKLPRQ